MKNHLQGGYLLRIFLGAATLLLSIVVALWIGHRKSVLFRYVEETPSVYYPVVTVFNPFRDREPERSAEIFLKRVSAGKCTQALSSLKVVSQELESLCKPEDAEPLTGWSTIDRYDKENLVEIDYWVTFTGVKQRCLRRLTVERINSQWAVTAYNVMY